MSLIFRAVILKCAYPDDFFPGHKWYKVMVELTSHASSLHSQLNWFIFNEMCSAQNCPWSLWKPPYSSSSILPASHEQTWAHTALFFLLHVVAPHLESDMVGRALQTPVCMHACPLACTVESVSSFPITSIVQTRPIAHWKRPASKKKLSSSMD